MPERKVNIIFMHFHYDVSLIFFIIFNLLIKLHKIIQTFNSCDNHSFSSFCLRKFLIKTAFLKRKVNHLNLNLNYLVAVANVCKGMPMR